MNLVHFLIFSPLFFMIVLKKENKENGLSKLIEGLGIFSSERSFKRQNPNLKFDFSMNKLSEQFGLLPKFLTN